VRISELRIKNFRSLVDVVIPLEPCTVIMGENNSGKSSVLEALRVVFSRGNGRRSAPVTEYDFHLSDDDTDPRSGSTIEIETVLAEGIAGEWPADVVQALSEIVQTDPGTGASSINLRVSCAYDPVTKAYESSWQFLNSDGQSLTPGRTVSNSRLQSFLQYVPLFHLSALRDGADEFSARSQFWGQLLRSVDIPEDTRRKIAGELEQLNSQLLDADPRLGDVSNTLGRVRDVMPGGGIQGATVRALPLKPWDLMSRSEIVLQGQSSHPSLPLMRHGQGVQSLAILYLFHAFVDHLLKTAFEEDSEPILALEEPEVHLHPQAVRSLWRQLAAFPGQKIITTHSPYFVQNVPFRHLRLLRRSGATTRVHRLATSFTVEVPSNQAIKQFAANNAAKFSYDDSTQHLSVRGQVIEGELRDLMICFSDPETRNEIHARLRGLRDQAASYLSDTELRPLETYVRRMRGEILFARCWLLCEGPSDYTMLHCFAEILGTPLDAHGVAVIDYQNNGSPRAFVALARAFAFPWLMVCDGDPGGSSQKGEVEKRGFSERDVREQVIQLPERDIEAFLVKNGFAPELGKIVQANFGVEPSSSAGTPEYADELAAQLRRHKTEYATMLAQELLDQGAGTERVPQIFATLIEQACEAAHG